MQSNKEEPTLIVVSVQECQPILYNVTESNSDVLAPVEIWRTMIQSIVGNKYTIIGNKTMGAIQCTVYCKTNMIHKISHMSANHVACGIGNIFQNKGAVGISFNIYDTSIAFIGAHLPAHKKNVIDR